MFRAWLKQLRLWNRPRTIHTRRPAKATPLSLEQLEDRCCPSTTTVAIASGASFGPFNKGDKIHLDVNVDTSDPNELTENEEESATITSTGGFSANVMVFDTQSFDYTATQDGETFSVSISDGDETGTIDVDVNSPHVKFVTEPADGVPNEFLNAITVQVVNADGTPDTAYQGNIDMQFGSNFNQNAKLIGTFPKPAQGGQATFDDMYITESGKEYFLIAHLDDGTEGESTYFNVFNTLKIIQQPSNAFADTSISPPITVEVDRPDGTPDAGFNGMIHAAIGNDPTGGKATLSGTVDKGVDASNGTATFDDLKIDKLGLGYTLAFSISDDPTATTTSNTFNIGHTVRFVTQLTDGVPNEIFNPITVEVDNPDGSPETTYKDNIDLQFAGSNPNAKLIGTFPKPAMQGSVTFNDVYITQSGMDYSLIAQLPDGTEGESNLFNVFNTLKITQQPSNASANTAIAPPITVEVDRPDGSVDTGFQGQISVALDNDPTGGKATLAGTVTRDVNSQTAVATFDDLKLDKDAVGYSLKFTIVDDPTVTVASDAFNVGPFLAITQQPTDAAPKQVDPITVELQNPDGSADTGMDGTQLTLTLDTFFGSGTASGATATFSGGKAVFDKFSIDKSGEYAVIADIGDGSPAESDFFNVFDTVTFTGQPTDTVVGQTIDPAVVVEVDRPDGMADDQFTGNVDLKILDDPSGGAAKLSGTIPMPAMAGVATFKDLSIDVGGASYSFVASIDDGTEAFSNFFNVQHILTFKQQPSNSFANGIISPAIQVEVDNANGKVDAGFTGDVTIDIDNNPNSGLLSGTAVVAAKAGVATFDDLSIDQKGIGYTLKATVEDGAELTSGAFDVTEIKAREIHFGNPRGIDYNYLISGGALPEDVPVALYWSPTDTFSDATATIVDGTQMTIPKGTEAQNDPFQVHVSESLLQTPPAGAKFLVLVVGDPAADYFVGDLNTQSLALSDVTPTAFDWNNDAAELQKTDTSQRNRIDYSYDVNDADLAQAGQGQFFWSNFAGADPSTIKASNWKSFVIGANPASQPFDLNGPENSYNESDPGRFGTPPDGATGLLFVVDPNNQLIESNRDNDFAFLKMHTTQELLAGAVTTRLVDSNAGILAFFEPGGDDGRGVGQYSLSEAETRLGVDHFNWVQYVTVPSNWQPVTLGNIDNARVEADAAADGSTGLTVTGDGLIAYDDNKPGGVISQYAIGSTFLDPIVQFNTGDATNSVTRAFIITGQDGSKVAEAWLNDPTIVGGTGPNPDAYYYYLRENDNQEWGGVHNPRNVGASILEFQDEPSQLDGAFDNSPTPYLSFQTQLVGVNYDISSFKTLAGIDPSIQPGFNWRSNTVPVSGSITDVTLFGSHQAGAPAGTFQGGITNVQTTADLSTFAPPTSSVDALPASSPNTFTVSWSGQPAAGVAGVVAYSIYVSDNGGPFTPFVVNVPITSAPFTGQPGHTYGFYSVATDTAGGVQPTPSAAQATTTVEGTPSGFSYDPDTKVLTIHGTAASNDFQFQQATTADALHTTYTFTLNGETRSYEDTELSEVLVTADGSANTAEIVTSDTYVGLDGLVHETSEPVVIGDGFALVEKFGQSGEPIPFVQAGGFTSVFARLGAADGSVIVGTPGVTNTFVSAGTYSYMNSGSAFYLISGAGYVYAYAATAGDTAFHYDGSGPSTYIASGTAYSAMSGVDNGRSFYNEAVGFLFNNGIAQHGGDMAIFYDSPANDLFVAMAGYSTMTSHNADGSLAEFDSASGFDAVYAYSFVGGFNTAINNDPNHTFVFGFA